MSQVKTWYNPGLSRFKNGGFLQDGGILHYDPETKQSRPIRKYLGVEDPETGKLIPSSGLRGRKKADGSAPSKREHNESKYKAKYERLQKECEEKAEKIKQLEHENKRMRFFLSKMRDSISEMIDSE